MRIRTVRAAGVAALASMGSFLMALSIVAIGVAREAVEFSAITPPLRPDSLSAFYVLRAYYWPAVWLAMFSILLMTVIPLGLDRALQRSRELSLVAAESSPFLVETLHGSG